MMKPPNVQPVYPLRADLPERQTIVKIAGAGERKGPVVLFNLELQDPRGLLAVGGHKYMFKILRQLTKLDKVAGFDVVVLVSKKNLATVNRYIKNMGAFADSVHILEIADPYNIVLDKDTEAAIKASSRQLIWLSQCTQQNFFTAFEKLGAAIVGYANEDFSHTQTFNCHKVNQFKVGVALSQDDLADEQGSAVADAINQISADKAFNKEVGQAVFFYGKLLSEDERISKMDLEYWIDYVYLFGVSDFIPLYDKMNPITYRNWDVFAVYWVILIGVFSLLYLVCKHTCCRLCGSSKKD